MTGFCHFHLWRLLVKDILDLLILVFWKSSKDEYWILTELNFNSPESEV